MPAALSPGGIRNSPAWIGSREPNMRAKPGSSPRRRGSRRPRSSWSGDPGEARALRDDDRRRLARSARARPRAARRRRPAARIASAGSEDQQDQRASSRSGGAQTAFITRLALVPPKPKLLLSTALHLALLGDVRHQVDAGRALARIVEVERRRHDLVAQREDAEDRLDRAGAAEQMADRRLGRAHRDVADRIAEQAADRAELELVAERRRGAVGVDIVDVGRGRCPPASAPSPSPDSRPSLPDAAR